MFISLTPLADNHVTWICNDFILSEHVFYKRNTNILAEFEEEVGKVVRDYEDRLMEEVTDAQTSSLLSAHEGVQRRTMTLR